MEIEDDKLRLLIKDKHRKLHQASQQLYRVMGAADILIRQDIGGNLAVNEMYRTDLPDDEFFAHMRQAIQELNQHFHELNAIRNLVN